MHQPPFHQQFTQQAPGPSYPVPPPRKPTPWQKFRSARKRTRWGIGCGVATLIVLLSLCTCGSVGAALNPQRTATLVPTATTSTLTDGPTSGVQSATSVPTQSTVDATPTTPLSTAPTATSAPVDTPVPTVAPTQPPLVPTPFPTQAPVPTQPPAPTQPPTGTNGNPWGYSFAPGNLIYSPAAGFCSYFGCVSTFWTATRGYVVECANGLYSHSGGVRGACSRDGGPSAILYSH